MASSISNPGEAFEPARKRQKLSPPIKQITAHVGQNAALEDAMSEARRMAESTAVSQLSREAQVGILCFVNETNPGFSGVLKQRYTDFLVNEITPDGKVVHLTDINVPRRNDPRKTSKLDYAPPDSNVQDPEAPVAVPVESAESSVVAEPGQGLENVTDDKPTNSHSRKSFSLTPEDADLLESYFGTAVRHSILQLHENVLQKPTAKPALVGSIFSDPITDRQKRTQLHKDVRRIFNSQLDTASDANGVIKIFAAQRTKPQGRYVQNGDSKDNALHNQQKGKLGWQELGGEHLHFSLYKENKDTMEVISYISSRLRTNAKQFAFAGTKDRRGVTVQRVSVYRVRAEDLVNLNKTLFGSKIGDFKYEKHRLELGELMGNEFLITLRDCQFSSSENLGESERLSLANKVVGEAVKNMQNHGFINYYGLQRFGSYATGTDEVGKKILQGDFGGAVDAILEYSEDALASALNPVFVAADGRPLPRDDIARAHALHIFKTTGKSSLALEKLPKKFSGETAIIRFLGRNPRDYAGALMQITRNLRLMYVHAYQSLVWNLATSERWARFGNKVIKGDLVLVDTASAKNTTTVKEDEVDENGEIIVLPAADDVAVSHDGLFQRARPLRAEEVASGNYSIFDIVLPTPGYDIEYPDNEIGDFYKDFMASERGGRLDPGNMRRAQKDFSLSGSYRQLLAQIGNDVTYKIKLYSDDNEQMVETDLEKIMKSNPNVGNRGQRNRSLGGPAARQDNAQQHNAWKNLPSQLADEDKIDAALLAAQKLKKSSSPKAELLRPMYKEIFIQTSPERGERTGHRETTVIPGNNVTTSEAASNVETALQDKTGVQGEVKPEQDNGPLTDTPGDDIPTKPAGSISSPNDTESGARLDIAEEQSELPAEMAFVDEVKKNDEVEEENKPEEQEKKIAVIVKFQLGSSQYATMALRELMKQGGVQAYRPDFSSGR